MSARLSRCRSLQTTLSKQSLSKGNARCLTSSTSRLHQVDTSNKEADSPFARRHDRGDGSLTSRNKQWSSRGSEAGQQHRSRWNSGGPIQTSRPNPLPQMSNVNVTLDGQSQLISTLLLRDLCGCPRCLDRSTKQKLFSTVDIPPGIRARAIAQSRSGVSLLWDQDIPGYGRDHTTELSLETLRALAKSGAPSVSDPLERRALWDAESFGRIRDIEYEYYMQDDAVLYQALRQLNTQGLLFLSGVPGLEASVSAIAERIGPVKNTFYGYTWDVRSVPQAKNVAYTSQDLGFHMDLLYMQQPPHLQFLHCIRSSSAGGASLFTDSYKAASDLFTADIDAFVALTKQDINFHYYHPSSNVYHQRRKVLQLRALNLGIKINAENLRKLAESSTRNDTPDVSDWINGVSWAPPFQAPFSTKSSVQAREKTAQGGHFVPGTLERLNRNIQQWHAAATAFNALIHRPDGIYERMMKPGECVIFDNRRVLHGRKAFEVADAGKERWLRGAYLDQDPYLSKLRVLQRQFGFAETEAGKQDFETKKEYFAAAPAGDS